MKLCLTCIFSSALHLLPLYIQYKHFKLQNKIQKRRIYRVAQKTNSFSKPQIYLSKVCNSFLENASSKLIL